MPTDKPRFGIDYGKGESPGPVCTGDRNVVERSPHRDQCQENARRRGQQTFTLVEQDYTSPLVICEWIKQNILTCPPPKLFEALHLAINMRSAPNRKAAD